MERKGWSQEEDNILREAVLEEPELKWTIVSQIMQEKYGVIGRTGKQCRQRWYNHLAPDIRSQVWTSEEESELLRHHNLVGNRWSRIARYLPGRTDNNIKNHFYCRIRRAVRRFNCCLKAHKNKWIFRELGQTLLSKVLTVAEDRFQRKLNVSEELWNRSSEIKNRLLPFADCDDLKPEDETKMKELADLLEDFNKSYKKRRGRKKGNVRCRDYSSSDDEAFPQMLSRTSANIRESLRTRTQRKRGQDEQLQVKLQDPSTTPKWELAIIAKADQPPNDEQTDPFQYEDRRAHSTDSANLDFISNVLRKSSEEISSYFEFND